MTPLSFLWSSEWPLLLPPVLFRELTLNSKTLVWGSDTSLQNWTLWQIASSSFQNIHSCNLSTQVSHCKFLLPHSFSSRYYCYILIFTVFFLHLIRFLTVIVENENQTIHLWISKKVEQGVGGGLWNSEEKAQISVFSWVGFERGISHVRDNRKTTYPLS